MIYYLSNIVWDKSDIKEREFINYEAATRRVKYIVESITSNNEKVTIISEGECKKRKLFKKKEISISDKVKIIYLNRLNYKVINRISALVSLFRYMIKNITRDDKIIIYNANIIQILASYCFRFFVKCEIIIEFEEFYIEKNKYIKMMINRLSEYIGIKMSNKFIITNKNMLNKITKIKKNKSIEYIVSAGYINDKVITEFSEEKVIYYGGRFDYEGGIDILIESLEFIKIKSKVIFTGNIKSEYLEKINKISNKNLEVEIRGFVDEKELNHILSYKCICINPIRSKYEFSKYSFPSKILQYLQMGNIVISSEINSLQQLNELNEYIYIYENDNPRDLAKKINELLEYDWEKVNIMARTQALFENDKKTINLFLKG